MFEDYKKDLVKLFKKLHDEGAFSGLFDKLSQQDHYIKIKYSTVEYEWCEDLAEYPLCYLYNHKLFYDRESFLKVRGTHLPNDEIPPDVFDDDLLGITSIASSMAILYEKYFDEVFEKVEKIYKNKVRELNKDLDFSPNIYFYTYDILLFVIEERDGIYQGLYGDEGKYKDKLPSAITKMKYGKDEKKLFYDIRNENRFEELEELTKTHINNFYSLVENTNFEKIERSTVDYSPFLSPLWKATEVEFDHHFKYYSDDIVKSAKILLKKAEEHWNRKLRDKHRILLNKCKKMIERRDNYRSEGLYTIYLVLYHLALGKELELENQFESYLNQKQFIELNRESEIISDLRRESRNRNLLIHQNVLNSKNLFQRQQSLMISILNIFSLIKEYRDLD